MKATEEAPLKKTKYDEDDDIAQCPVLKDQLGTFTPEQLKEMRKKYDEIVKPMMQKNKKKEEEEKKECPEKAVREEKKAKVRGRHPRFEKYRQSQGACPYMNTSMQLLFVCESGLWMKGQKKCFE